MIKKIVIKIFYFINKILEKVQKIKLERKGNKFHKTVILRKNTFVINSEIGKYSGLNYNSTAIETKIGNFVNISWNVQIGPRSHIYKNFTSHDFIYINNEHIHLSSTFEKKFLNKIGHDVWIGCNSIILPSVEIGNGAIIAAGSIVTKSVPEYAIVGGNPAKFIKWRFNKKIIEKLKKINWYEWEIEEILKRKEELEEIVEFKLENYYKEYFSRRKDIKIE